MKYGPAILMFVGGLLLMVGGGGGIIPLPKPEPDPVPVDSRAMLVVYDMQAPQDLPKGQREIIGSTPLRDWMAARSIRYRLWDDQQVVAGQDAETQAFSKLFQQPRDRVPWLHLSTGYSAPLPPDMASLEALLLEQFGLPAEVESALEPTPLQPSQGDAYQRFPSLGMAI